MRERLKVAVVGSGIGREHVAAWLQLPDHFQLAAFCDVDLARGEAVAASAGIKRFVTSFDALCAMDDIDVIDICTPPFLHVEQSLQALAAGKHVVSEKPVAASLADIDRLVAAEARSGRRLMPIFNYRFGASIQRLRHLIQLGVTGPRYLSTVETAWKRGMDYYRAVPWRGTWEGELGGCLVSHAIHAHDALYYLVGKPRRVYARLATRVNPIEVEDTAAIALEMADGSLATLAVTLGSVQEITRHRYCFANLTAESNTLPYAANGSEPWQFIPASPAAADALQDALARFEPGPEGFVGQFARFYRALQDGAELPVTLADARNAIELITACYDSARHNQPLELPLGPDHALYGGWKPAALDS
ncbi:MAG: Gfo/Idh/MocA family oxidoreductase [Caldilineaceae bacterium]|nr:Gfo/Idh/MocA family oxidoreductase [Caldilineaceae bacterium]